MKYAVIRTGGKQYKVSEGDVVDVEHLRDMKPNQEIAFEEVLLVADGTDIKIGAPTISGMVVRGVLKEDIKGEKIRVMKFKSKVRYRKVRGHRQSLSRVAISSIGGATKSKEKVIEEKPSTKRATRKKAA